MDKWKYKFSFFSGLFFISTFFMKEMLVNSPDEMQISLYITPFFFMILYSVGLFLGYVKYAMLNEKLLLKISSILMMVAYGIIVVVEFLDRLFNISGDLPYVILWSKLFLGLVLILFGVALLLRKTIYGKSTILQWITAILLGLTFMIPNLFIIQLPLFFLFFISIIYLVKKRGEK